MLPEQIPGTLFVILLALVALPTGQYDALILLAIGCAFGWFGMVTRGFDQLVKGISFIGALAFWAWALGLIIWRIL